MFITENVDLELNKNFEIENTETFEVKKRFIVFHTGVKLEYLKRFVV